MIVAVAGIANHLLLFAVLAITFPGGPALAGNIDGTISDLGTAASPELTIRLDASGISIAGQISSAANESILRDLVSSPDGPAVISFDVHETGLTPPGWALLTELALRATLLTHFSDTAVTVSGVSIQGVTAESGAWAKALARLETALLPGMKLHAKVLSIAPATTFEKLCRQEFDALTKSRTIEFAPASAVVEASAHPLLDGLIEISVDCPQANLAIRASGDGPASVAANRVLGDARAINIAEYLTGQGLDPGRISVLPADDQAGGRLRQVKFVIAFDQPQDRSAL